jgi:hypothetical protein
MGADLERIREPARGGARVPAYRWVNPMPQLPSGDVKMILTLQSLGLDYWYRLPASKWQPGSVMLKALIPDWAPEFVFPVSKVVIVILGAFFGNIPSVIDATALGKAILEREGWKVAVITSFDLETKGPGQMLLPLLGRLPDRAGRKGRMLNADTMPDVMEQFRRMRENSRVFISTNVRVSYGSSRSAGPGNRVRRQRRGGRFSVVRDYRRTSDEVLRKRSRS